MWTGRILLESMHCPLPSTFLTLTYSDETVPEGQTVVKKDAQAFLNRLRHRSGVGHVRYFGVGEYGTKTQRPHYHFALFNLPPAPYEKILEETWGKGLISVGEIEPRSAAYVCGYATKKMTNSNDERLDGREPEFAIMSKSPPLGAAGIRHIEELLHTRSGAAGLAKNGDVPSTFRTLGRQWPLGKYWREQLRKRLNIEKPAPNADWELDIDKHEEERRNAEKKVTKIWATTYRAHRAKAL